MGVLNVTPDSFSDGGACLEVEAAVRRGRELAAQGADVIDVGGESTRPGAAEVPPEEELRRVLPVLERLAAVVDVPLSVDTRRAEVARRALEAGARVVNDVSALGDPRMAQVCAAAGATVVLMHMRGRPADMQADPRYDDVVGEVAGLLAGARERARREGVAPGSIWVDPGIGFGKTLAHNLALLAALPRLRVETGCPLLVGVSRKSFLGALTGRPVAERVHGTAGAVAMCVAGGADAVRVHDVAEMRDVVKVCDAIRRSANRN
ncbi:MAG: dihydropteroate synthase [Planctomycetes bacterium]|nr:dihydropteroate synthase [Planctomycetota bacterium]